MNSASASSHWNSSGVEGVPASGHASVTTQPRETSVGEEALPLRGEEQETNAGPGLLQ